jgi:hypothetical protein
MRSLVSFLKMLRRAHLKSLRASLGCCLLLWRGCIGFQPTHWPFSLASSLLNVRGAVAFGRIFSMKGGAKLAKWNPEVKPPSASLTP